VRLPTIILFGLLKNKVDVEVSVSELKKIFKEKMQVEAHTISLPLYYLNCFC